MLFSDRLFSSDVGMGSTLCALRSSPEQRIEIQMSIFRRRPSKGDDGIFGDLPNQLRRTRRILGAAWHCRTADGIESLKTGGVEVGAGTVSPTAHADL
jgi:hypothetical protein